MPSNHDVERVQRKLRRIRDWAAGDQPHTLPVRLNDILILMRDERLLVPVERELHEFDRRGFPAKFEAMAKHRQPVFTSGLERAAFAYETMKRVLARVATCDGGIVACLELDVHGAVSSRHGPRGFAFAAVKLAWDEYFARLVDWLDDRVESINVALPIVASEPVAHAQTSGQVLMVATSANGVQVIHARGGVVRLIPSRLKVLLYLALARKFRASGLVSLDMVRCKRAHFSDVRKALRALDDTRVLLPEAEDGAYGLALEPGEIGVRLTAPVSEIQAELQWVLTEFAEDLRLG